MHDKAPQNNKEHKEEDLSIKDHYIREVTKLKDMAVERLSKNNFTRPGNPLEIINTSYDNLLNILDLDEQKYLSDLKSVNENQTLSPEEKDKKDEENTIIFCQKLDKQMAGFIGLCDILEESVIRNKETNN